MPLTIPAIKTPGKGPAGPGPFDFPSRQALAVGHSPSYGLRWQPPDPRTATTVRYVRKTGSDSNGGTSPADAWLTIGKAMTTVALGTVVYVGAGTYRESVQVTSGATPNAPVWLIGDVDGVFTGDAGAVIVTNFTTNDLTAASSTPVLDFQSRNGFVVRNLVLIAGGAGNALAFNTGHHIHVSDCAMISTAGTAAVVGMNTQAGVAAHQVLDRCLVLNYAQNPAINVSLARNAFSDFDYHLWITNCVVHDCGGGNGAILNTTAGAGTGLGGGIRLLNNTILSQRLAVGTNDANSSATIPTWLAYNNIIFSGTGIALKANVTGQIVEDYNIISAGTARQNVTAGLHSVAVRAAPTLHAGQEHFWGGQPRPFGEPMAGSSFLGFGAANVLAGLLDGASRPRQQSPTEWPIGALGRGNTFTESTAISEDGDGYSIALTGPGSQDFDIPLDAGPCTISVWVEYDANYSGPLPELWILPNGEMGLGSAGTPLGLPSRAVALPGMAGQWQQLSCVINPSAFGIVTARVLSSDGSGVAVTTFDAFMVQ